MKTAIFSLLAIPCLVTVNSATAKSDNQTLCKPGEIEVASCSLMDEKKSLSICANLAEKSAFYYSATKEKNDLTIKFTNDRKIYRWLDENTYTTFLGFIDEGYSHTLGIPQKTPGAKAFLYKGKSNVAIDFNSPKLCDQNSFGEKNLILEAISDVADKTVREAEFVFPPNSLIPSQSHEKTE